MKETKKDKTRQTGKEIKNNGGAVNKR